MPLFVAHHWVVEIRWRVFAHLAPAGRVEVDLRGRVERSGMVKGVHLMGHHTTSYRNSDCSSPNQRSQQSVASNAGSLMWRDSLRQPSSPKPPLLYVRQWRLLVRAHRLDLAIGAGITSIGSLQQRIGQRTDAVQLLRRVSRGHIRSGLEPVTPKEAGVSRDHSREGYLGRVVVVDLPFGATRLQLTEALVLQQAQTKTHPPQDTNQTTHNPQAAV